MKAYKPNGIYLFRVSPISISFISTFLIDAWCSFRISIDFEMHLLVEGITNFPMSYQISCNRNQLIQQHCATGNSLGTFSAILLLFNFHAMNVQTFDKIWWNWIKLLIKWIKDYLYMSDLILLAPIDIYGWLLFIFELLTFS